MEISPEQKAKYISRRHADLAECVAAQAKKDLSVFQRVGHQMKGNGLTFGYPDLATLGESMETAAKANDWAKLDQELLRFEAMLGQITPG